MKFPGVMTATASLVRSNSRAALQEWLVQNREQLIDAIRHNTPAAKQMMSELCRTQPAAALPVNLIMANTPDEAIKLVAMLDHEFADCLRPLTAELAALQAEWKSTC